MAKRNRSAGLGLGRGRANGSRTREDFTVAQGQHPEPMRESSGLRPGRRRDPQLDAAILAAAERQLRVRGYAGMSMASVASAAGTTVPSLRRRFSSKCELVTSVIDSLRVEPLPPSTGVPRADALMVLANFERNLGRPYTMATLGTILAEEDRHPILLEHFRSQLVRPRRAMLRQAFADGVRAGDLPSDLDLDATVNMLIGSFYARFVSGEQITDGWAGRVLLTVWPENR
jgi:AcrR family transcriptional regulator